MKHKISISIYSIITHGELLSYECFDKKKIICILKLYMNRLKFISKIHRFMGYFIRYYIMNPCVLIKKIFTTIFIKLFTEDMLYKQKLKYLKMLRKLTKKSIIVF